MADLTLYFFPGTCSRISLIALCETGTAFDAKLVNILAGENRSADYLALNPAGKIPALTIDGSPLTETIAIVHYLHDHFPEAGLLPYNGDRKHDTHVLSDLAWLNATVQPILTRLRTPMVITPDPASFHDVALRGAEAMRLQFGLIEQRLAGEPYLAGEKYSILDAMAVWLHDQSTAAGLPTDEFPQFAALVDRVMSRPAVQQALGREGAAMGALAAQGLLPPPLPKFI